MSRIANYLKGKAQQVNWDDKKRAREEEYFHREEKDKVEKLRDEKEKLATHEVEGQEIFAPLKKVSSPITGASMFKSTVTDEDFLDCPEEKTMMISYKTLRKIMRNAEDGDKHFTDTWRTFLDSHH